MCKCTPDLKTPFCGELGCEWPKKETANEFAVTSNGLQLNAGGYFSFAPPQKMNYCATHNQFCHSHCVYCGEPAKLPISTSGYAQTAAICSRCGQTIWPGATTHLCVSAGTTANYAYMCAGCNELVYVSDHDSHVCTTQ